MKRICFIWRVCCFHQHNFFFCQSNRVEYTWNGDHEFGLIFNREWYCNMLYHTRRKITEATRIVALIQLFETFNEMKRKKVKKTCGMHLI